MNECLCGHKHCCHQQKKKRKKETRNDYGVLIRFTRVECADCGFWLSDENPEIISRC